MISIIILTMILTVDIGNTNITCGLFDGELLIKKFRLPSDITLDVEEYSRLFDNELPYLALDGVMMASVVEELNSTVWHVILALYGVRACILSQGTKLSIKISLPNPKSLGADRIANSVRGYELYHKSVIVIDFGTATTFDIVNSEGEFVGGLIAPGIETQLNSLSVSTSKLPKIYAKEICTSIGNNTHDSVLAGVVRGTACMVDGMIEHVKTELKITPAIVLTGGFSGLISKYIQADFDLQSYDITLEGLNSIYNFNFAK